MWVAGGSEGLLSWVCLWTAGQVWVCVMVPKHTEAEVLPLPMRPCLNSLVHYRRLPGGLKLGTPWGLPADAHS